MGWFGPTISSRMKNGREEFYGKCPTCKDEHVGKSKGNAVNAINACEKSHIQDALDELKAKKKKDVKQAHKDRKATQEETAEKKRKKAADELKSKMVKGMRQKRREAKGKCPFCSKTPCQGTRPKCAKVLAEKLQSSMDFDVTDPGAFDEQLRWYNDNMR